MDDRLMVLAEISVGLTGFSSIVVVFRRRDETGAWRPEDAFRFKVMLEAGLCAGLFALLPGAVTGLLGFGPATWPTLSSLLLGYVVFDLVRRARQMRSLPRASLRLGIIVLSAVGNFAVIAVQALNLIGLWVPRGSGPYLFGVSWLTAYSGLTFYRLVTAPIVTAEPSATRPPDGPASD